MAKIIQFRRSRAFGSWDADMRTLERRRSEHQRQQHNAGVLERAGITPPTCHDYVTWAWAKAQSEKADSTITIEVEPDGSKET